MTKSIAVALVCSRLDYANSVLFGISAANLQNLCSDDVNARVQCIIASYVSLRLWHCQSVAVMTVHHHCTLLPVIHLLAHCLLFTTVLYDTVLKCTVCNAVEYSALCI